MTLYTEIETGCKEFKIVVKLQNSVVFKMLDSDNFFLKTSFKLYLRDKHEKLETTLEFVYFKNTILHVLKLDKYLTPIDKL